METVQTGHIAFQGADYSSVSCIHTDAYSKTPEDNLNTVTLPKASICAFVFYDKPQWHVSALRLWEMTK